MRLLVATLSVCSFIACEDETRQPAPAATGTLAIALGADAPVHDVAAIHVKVVAGGADCDAEAIAEQVVPLEEEFLPEHLAMGGNHPFADALFVLEPGDYHVCAQPLTEDGDPSEACGLAEGDATVVAGATEEIVIWSQCEGDPNGEGEGGATGGLDVVVGLNSPPRIDVLLIAPSKFIDTCEAAEIIVSASDPNDDPLHFEWAILESPPGSNPMLQFNGDQAAFTTDVGGPYLLEVVVTDGKGGEASLSFPIHVSDCEDDDSPGDGGPPGLCQPEPEICNDGFDNDCDLIADCADPDCANLCQPPPCQRACDAVVECAGQECNLNVADAMAIADICLNACEQQPDFARVLEEAVACGVLIDLAEQLSNDFADLCNR